MLRRQRKLTTELNFALLFHCDLSRTCIERRTINIEQLHATCNSTQQMTDRQMLTHVPKTGILTHRRWHSEVVSRRVVRVVHSQMHFTQSDLFDNPKPQYLFVPRYPKLCQWLQNTKLTRSRNRNFHLCGRQLPQQQSCPKP